MIPEAGLLRTGSSHGRCPRTLAAVKAPFGSFFVLDFLLGSPPVTAARRLGRCRARAGCAATGSVEHYQPSIPFPMPTKQPSFSERCRQMRAAAEQLLEISAFVNDEAVRMAVAQA